jgi:hypothetical protein
MTSAILETGTAILARHIDNFVEHRRRQAFALKVGRALAELGLQASKFDVRLRQLYTEVCDACYAKHKMAADPYALALEFFLRLVIEYPTVVGNAVMYEGVLIDSISVIRSWHTKGRIGAERAGRDIDQVKRYLLEQLRSLDLPEDGARLATEIQILGL